MDTNRRHFFKDLTTKSAGIAAGAAAPALVHLNTLGDDLKALRKDLSIKLLKTSAEVKGQIQTIHKRLDGAAIKQTYQQMQLYFIFLLLALSFAIDAGMTAVWALG